MAGHGRAQGRVPVPGTVCAAGPLSAALTAPDRPLPDRPRAPSLPHTERPPCPGGECSQRSLGGPQGTRAPVLRQEGPAEGQPGCAQAPLPRRPQQAWEAPPLLRQLGRGRCLLRPWHREPSVTQCAWKAERVGLGGDVRAEGSRGQPRCAVAKGQTLPAKAAPTGVVTSGGSGGRGQAASLGPLEHLAVRRDCSAHTPAGRAPRQALATSGGDRRPVSWSLARALPKARAAGGLRQAADTPAKAPGTMLGAVSEDLGIPLAGPLPSPDRERSGSRGQATGSPALPQHLGQARPGPAPARPVPPAPSSAERRGRPGRGSRAAGCSPAGAAGAATRGGRSAWRPGRAPRGPGRRRGSGWSR